MEAPTMDRIFKLLNEQGLDFKMETTSFFFGRQKLLIGEKHRMSRWRSALFIFMARNSMDAAAFFDIPTDKIIEVGVQLEI